jgi:hypothetical protein
MKAKSWKNVVSSGRNLSISSVPHAMSISSSMSIHWRTRNGYGLLTEHWYPYIFSKSQSARRLSIFPQWVYHFLADMTWSDFGTLYPPRIMIWQVLLIDLTMSRSISDQIVCAPDGHVWTFIICFETSLIQSAAWISFDNASHLFQSDIGRQSTIAQRWYFFARLHRSKRLDLQT